MSKKKKCHQAERKWYKLEELQTLKRGKTTESIRLGIALWSRKKSIFSVIIVITINITSEMKLKLCK